MTDEEERRQDCQIFEIRPRTSQDHYECLGDGHYLCKVCPHMTDSLKAAAAHPDRAQPRALSPRRLWGKP